MFGYHDSNRCGFDLWSPVTMSDFGDEDYGKCEYADPVQKGYGVWEDTNGVCAIENRAFSPYCKHMQECEDVVAAIRNGQTSFTLDDDFDQSDLDYINDRLSEYGIYANLSLE